MTFKIICVIIYIILKRGDTIIKKSFKLIFASLLTFISKFYSKVDYSLIVLISVILIDYITGLIKAYVNKELNSKIGFKGLLKKLGIFVIILLSFEIDKLILANGALKSMTVFYYVSIECLSIFENFGKIGIPIPNFLKGKLQQLNQDEKEEEQKIE